MQLRPFAIPLLFIPGVASADVTPQDVWDNLVAGYGAAGITLSATLETSGDTLIANDGVATLAYPVIGGQATATLPPMTLTAQGDGTVRITTPSTYVSELVADIPEESEQITLDVTIAMNELDSVASGDPGDVVYVSSVASFGMLATNLSVPGETIDAFNIQFESEGYESETRMTVSDTTTISNTATNRPSAITYAIDVSGFRQESTSSTGNLVTTFNAVIPSDTDIMNLAPALRAGLSIKGTAQSEGGNGTTTAYDGETVISEQIQTTGASTNSFGFDSTSLRTEGVSEGGSIKFSGQDVPLPFPIEATVGEVSGAFSIPLLANEAPQPFALSMDLSDLVIADDLWGLIDAAGNLDRSPIALAIDLSGEVTNSFDLVSPATWIGMDQGIVPVALNSLSINEIGFGALGAVISATGAFTLDNEDLQTFGGFPRPEGSASARAVGLNAAIDQLVAAGLVGEQDVTMPRMFMGMFAVAQGNDELTTEVEINAEGHVLLNGQRIQ